LDGGGEYILDEEADARDAGKDFVTISSLVFGAVAAFVIGGCFLYFMFSETTEPAGLTWSEAVFWGVPFVTLFLMGFAMALVLGRKLKK
jgi:hypothetical protein